MVGLFIKPENEHNLILKKSGSFSMLAPRTYPREWSWQRSLLLKGGILGMGVAVILSAGWPHPARIHDDRSLTSPVFHQPMASQLSSMLVTSASPTEVLPLLAVEAEEEDLQLTHRTLLVDLNLGSRVDLEMLPGIGMKLSDRIVAYRSIHGDFQQVEDLVKVSGIGTKRLQRLEPFATVQREVEESRS